MISFQNGIPLVHCSEILAFVCTRYVWITIIYNLTYKMAVYALVLFCTGTHELLDAVKPLMILILTPNYLAWIGICGSRSFTT